MLHRAHRSPAKRDSRHKSSRENTTGRRHSLRTHWNALQRPWSRVRGARRRRLVSNSARSGLGQQQVLGHDFCGEDRRALSRGPELPARKKHGARSSSRQREGRERALPVQNVSWAAGHWAATWLMRDVGKETELGWLLQLLASFFFYFYYIYFFKNLFPKRILNAIKF